jgi:hypothetical protein
MAYDSDALIGAGSDSGSNGVSSSTVPLAIKKALKPRSPMSTGAADGYGAANDPIFDNMDTVESVEDYDNPVRPERSTYAPQVGPPALGQLPYEDSPSAHRHEDTSSAPSAQAFESSVGSPQLPPVQPATPTLAQSRNPFIRVVQRMTGWRGPQPAPGQPYNGPMTTEDKVGAVGNFLTRLSSNYNENFGTPLDRELAMRRKQLGNEAAWRAAMVGTKMEANDINQQKADTAQSKMIGDMRKVGYTLNDPNNPQSGFRNLTEPEILSDPELGMKFRGQMSKMGLNDAQTDKIRDMLMGRYEVDPWVAAIAGDPTLSGQKISAQQWQNVNKVLTAKGITIKDLGTEGMWAVDRIGNKIHQVAAVGPSVARAQMYNMLKPVQAVDSDNNLSWMTAGNAIAQGAAPAGPGVSANSKQAQMQDIKVASQNVRSAINELQNPLPPDAIAELTMASRATDPTVLATEIDSLLGSQQLQPDQYKFLTWVGQLNERAMSLRNIAGMGAASDKLRDAITATLPGAKDANRDLMLTKLDAFDNMVMNLEKGIPTVGHSKTPIHSAVQSHGQGATVHIRASDGSVHKLPAENLSRARQRDPGLQVIQ